ncbi:hypothetical protein [Streptomyces rimosus]|uniref:hypothetical protein n=1 Tax=Streptomyces rimosus TaxID=1927 RepID=UPI0004C73744|nr:hypothetical protein [Streptomyces rimosus]
MGDGSYGIDRADTLFESPLPDGTGWLSGGGGGMGNTGHLARLDAGRSLRWVAVMFHSNPLSADRGRAARTVPARPGRDHSTASAMRSTWSGSVAQQ